jgi:formylglycine-generating enzyme required for sulfatase activity
MSILLQEEIFIPGGGYIYRVRHRIMEGDCQINHGPYWVEIPPLYVDKYPVTNAMYHRFIVESGYEPKDKANFLKHFVDGKPIVGEENLPVTWVSRDDALAYARFYNKDLPTDCEWQYFAAGPDRWLWPWGDEYDKHRLNADPFGSLTAVDAYPNGANPYGLMDLAGNAWEMTDAFEDHLHKFMLLRGGSFHKAPDFWHAEGGPHPNDDHLKCPLLNEALNRNGNVSFRCVRRVEK